MSKKRLMGKFIQQDHATNYTKPENPRILHCLGK